MKKLSLFIFILSVGISFSSGYFHPENHMSWDSGKNLNPTWQFDTLSIEKRIHIDNDTSKQGMSISLTFEYPVTCPMNLDINRLKDVFICIFIHEREIPSTTVSEAFEGMVERYTAEAVQYGKDWEKEDFEYINFSNFEENYTTRVDKVYSNLITTMSDGYSYLGGVHGMYYVRFDNIDLEEYTILSENSLFKDGYEEKLAEIIQQKVEERNNSENEQDHILLLVEVSEIKPNGNFYLDKEELVYIYNPYEISAYVQGIVEIAIPLDEVRYLFKERYVNFFDND